MEDNWDPRKVAPFVYNNGTLVTMASVMVIQVSLFFASLESGTLRHLQASTGIKINFRPLGSTNLRTSGIRSTMYRDRYLTKQHDPVTKGTLLPRGVQGIVGSNKTRIAARLYGCEFEMSGTQFYFREQKSIAMKIYSKT